MSRRTVTCVEWVCDGCGKPAEDDDEATIHFRPDESRPDTWESIDGKDVCDWCIEKRACAAYGHKWGEWRRWYTPPGTPPEERRDCLCCNIEGETRRV